MNRYTTLRRLALVATLLACTSGNAAPARTAPTPVPPEAEALIASRYAKAPDLKLAANTFAQAMVLKWQTVARTGQYDSLLARTASAAMMCLLARAARHGETVSARDMADWANALASTASNEKAQRLSNALERGQPMTVPIQEKPACAMAGLAN